LNRTNVSQLKRILLVFLVVAGGACGGASTSPGAPATTTCTGVPGTPCFGTNGYIEYIPGDLAVVVSVPHGGAMAPANIPDRTMGTTTTDTNTIELGRAVAAAFQMQTGRLPHLIICHLKRTKLDANREIVEAAQGNADAIQAWTEYHAFIERAITEVNSGHGSGVYIDLHGQSHAIQRLELGYLLSAATLDLTDAQLDGGVYAAQSSLHLVSSVAAPQFSQLLRGPTSFGGLLAARLPSVPSPSDPSPGADPYFDGGYSTDRHTALLPGLQIESNFSGVRDSAASRSAFGDALATAVATFANLHLGLNF